MNSAAPSIDPFAALTAQAAELNAINFGQGMPDFLPPGPVLRSAAVALQSDCHQYSESAGVESVRRAVANHASSGERRWDHDDEVTIVCGATEGLATAIAAIAGRGGEVVALEPFYPAYRQICELVGARFRAVGMQWAGVRWEIDFEALRSCLSPRTDILLLNSPHNPSGRVFDADEMAVLAGLVADLDLVVLSDEVFGDLFFDNPPVSPSTIDGLADRTIVCSSASKTLGVCGWRVGWLLADPVHSARLRDFHRHTTYCAPTPLQKAVEACLEWRGKTAFLNEQRRILAGNRDRLAECLSGLGFEVCRPEGGYFVMAKAPSRLSHLGGGKLAHHLLHALGVAAMPMAPFFSIDEVASPWLRFSVCLAEDRFSEGLERLSALGRTGRVGLESAEDNRAFQKRGSHGRARLYEEVS